MKNTLSTFPPLACIVLAAGQGTRMKSDLPKVLHPVAGMPMVSHVLKACEALEPEQIAIVIGPNATAIEKAVAPYPCVVQTVPRGTGDAVKAARKILVDFVGDIVVLFGDGPLITPETLRTLQRKRQETSAQVVVAGFSPDNPASYGRLVIDETGNLSSIVEASEATPDQNTIQLCNGGVMLFDAAKLWPLLDQLRDANVKNEFFLTDCIALAQREGGICVVAAVPADDVVGVNNRAELAEAERIMQRRLRKEAMLAGATMIDPDSVFLSTDTKIGRDVVIGPHVVFGSGVEIGDRVEVRAFCHLEQARILSGAVVGPFARVRPGSSVGEGAHIGNFVELKNAHVAAGAKINHLSYIGDATVGSKANIGAGTITCNYDGFRKSHTEIGAGAFIGSNSALVAPVKIGEGSFIGAGSVITQDVPPNTLAVARGRQSNIEGWAHRLKDSQKDK